MNTNADILLKNVATNQTEVLEFVFVAALCLKLHFFDL